VIHEPAQDHPSVVKLFGRSGSAAAYAIRDFLQRSDVPFEWIELKNDEQARAIGVQDIHHAKLPNLCVFGWYSNGVPHRSSDHRKTRLVPRSFTVGIRFGYLRCGAAGLSAAVYGASEGLKTVVVERWLSVVKRPAAPRLKTTLGFPPASAEPNSPKRARGAGLQFGAEILLAREGVRGEFSAG